MNAPIRLLHLLPFIMMLLLTACGGGDGGFRITGITPLTAESGRDVVFSFTANQEVASADWSFSEGASPTSSSDLMPTIRVGLPGELLVTVNAQNTTGQSARQTVTVQITGEPLPPHILGITPAGRAGAPGEMVTFTVQYEGYAETIAWNFDGGATPDLTTGNSVEVRLGESGLYEGQVTLSGPAGQDDLHFSYGVSTPDATLRLVSVSLAGETHQFRERSWAGAVTEGKATSWEWNFGGGADPNTNSAISPTIFFQQPGHYTGSVRVSDGQGQEDELAFSYEVVQLIPEGIFKALEAPIGAVGQTGVLMTSWENIPTFFAWQLDGGVTPLSSDKRSPTFELTQAGRFFGTVQAANEAGTSAPVDFSFVVAPYAAPAFLRQTAIERNLQTPISLARLSTGQLATLITDHVFNNRDDLSLLISTSSTPTGPADWFTAPAPEVQLQLSPLFEHDGQLFILTMAETDRVLLFTCEGIPTDDADWSVAALTPPNSFGHEGLPSNWTILDGLPAVVVEDRRTHALWLAQAKHAHPQQAIDWSVSVVAEPDPDRTFSGLLYGHQGRLAYVANGLTIPGDPTSGFGPPQFVQATDARPADATSWTTTSIADAGQFQQGTSDGFQTILVRQTATGFEIVRTESPFPSGPTDWQAQLVEWSPTGQLKFPTGILFDVSLQSGRLLIVRGQPYHVGVHADTGGFLELSRSVLPGLHPADAWQRVRVPDLNGAGGVALTNMADGRLILAGNFQPGPRSLVIADSPTW